MDEGIVPLLSVVGLRATICAALLPLDRQIQGVGGGSGDPAGAERGSNTQGGDYLFSLKEM
jgi:hypothetical protein